MQADATVFSGCKISTALSNFKVKQNKIVSAMIRIMRKLK
jgi:hypothetical protein